VSAIFASAFAFGIGFDTGVTAFYDRWNKGVCSYTYFFHTLLKSDARNNGKTSVIDTFRKNRCRCLSSHNKPLDSIGTSLQETVPEIVDILCDKQKYPDTPV
jgi:hypothetical protein